MDKAPDSSPAPTPKEQSNNDLTPRTVEAKARELEELKKRVAELEAEVSQAGGSPTHQQGSTESKEHAPSPEHSPASARVVERPSTSAAIDPTSDDVLIAKIRANLNKLGAGRKPAVLLCTGSYNPVHLQHVRMFYIARHYMTARTEYQIVGGIISPSHDKYVMSKNRRTPHMAIPSKHRIAMAELATAGSSWLCVGKWEVTRKNFLDYPTVLRRYKELIDQSFPDTEIRLMYLCGADHLLLTGPETLEKYGVACVTRPGYTQKLERSLGKRFRHWVYLVDDDEMLSKAIDTLSSTKVRKRLLEKQNVEELVGTTVAEYMKHHKVAEKCSGDAQWAPEDRAPVKFTSKFKMSKLKK